MDYTRIKDLSKYMHLLRLDCSNNQLTKLGHLPASLKTLRCFYNNP